MKDIVTTQMNVETIRADVAAYAERHAETVAQFHRIFYASPNTHGLTSWCGVPILKNPLDLWVFQEALWDLKPTLIIETGTAFGGSALFFATMLDRRGEGRVVSIDIEPHTRLPRHPRVSFIRGSSVDPAIVAGVQAMITQEDRVMVILDSDHSAAHVRNELDIYAGMVTQGQFLVVEDTNICGRPVERDWMGGPGPWQALEPWLVEHPEFVPDKLAERFLLTFYPGGWLRRV